MVVFGAYGLMLLFASCASGLGLCMLSVDLGEVPRDDDGAAVAESLIVAIVEASVPSPFSP